ncbi:MULTISPECIES: PD-(D/E)XK nuclease family transposase [Paenibacillus]|uniref:PD-(D/E)XK nuclease family transposase n=1 Tax=Paenibacillus TaxID=44249 RepID=UPI0009327752
MRVIIKFTSSSKKCVAINIVNFNMLANDHYHNVFHLREDHTDISLTDDIEIHFRRNFEVKRQQHYDE